jgi:hypothetical protein
MGSLIDVWTIMDPLVINICPQIQSFVMPDLIRHPDIVPTKVGAGMTPFTKTVVHGAGTGLRY